MQNQVFWGMLRKGAVICTALICFMGVSCDVHAADLQSAIYWTVRNGNPDDAQAKWISDAILYASATYGVDPILVTAVMESESGFDFGSMSHVGAIGLMQLMPGTASAVGVDPYDPLGNVIGGAIYLRTQLDNFSGWGEYGVTYAVAAYNAGPNAVRKYGGVPPYSETVNYVNNVAAAYQRIMSMLQG